MPGSQIRLSQGDGLKINEQWGARLFYGGMIALMLGLFVWLAGARAPEASVFLVAGAIYAVLVFRIVSHSFRAFTVMSWAFLLNYWVLISLRVEGALEIPAAEPWFVGFLIGGIAGGNVWCGRRSASKQLPHRKPDADGRLTGGWRLAVINGACVFVLLGIGIVQLVALSPTAAAAAVLAVSLMAGWALFRFPPSLEVRNGLIMLGLPVGYFAFGFLGGATDQMALPHAWSYGALAGMLIGGRYWSGPQFGEPRPPFYVPGKRRRRKRRPKQKQTPKRENPTVGAAHE
jgi:hypothetical protein